MFMCIKKRLCVVFNLWDIYMFWWTADRVKVDRVEKGYLSTFKLNKSNKNQNNCISINV